MTAAVFAIPGDIDLRTGGYTYDRRVMALLPRFGVAVTHLELPGGYPTPTPAELAATAQAFARVPKEAVLLVDGLAYGAMPEEAIARADGPIVALVHHPLCLETGLTGRAPGRAEGLRDGRARPGAPHRRDQRHDRAHARHGVRHPRAKDHGGGTRHRCGAASEGGRRVPAAGRAGRASQARRSAGTLRLLAVGSIVPRKGYDLLVQALDRLGYLDWELAIAGDRDRSPETTTALVRQIRRSKVRDRIELVGALDERALGALYAGTDLFVMASLYEGYGMVLAEALVRGLPIVATTGGAAAATVPDRAALKVPPGDVDALSRALRRAMTDAALRRKLADAAWAAGRKLPSWEDTARIVAGVIGGAAP